MAQKKRSVARASYLCVWSSSREGLRISVLTGDKVTTVMSRDPLVDQSILQVLDRSKRSLQGLRAIGIVADALGSFASSRLLLATLNVFAWSRSIPIVAIPASWEDYDPRELGKKLQSKLRGVKGFKGQVLPAYRAPADITVSTKQRKFTMTSS